MAKKVKKVKDPNKKSLWAEFKAFISKGSILDMAVGVVIGGAFSAIVTALVAILLSVCTWAVPGGLKGLITVLPALNAAQTGPVGQSFSAADLVEKTIEFAGLQGVSGLTVQDATYVQWQNTLLGKYSLHGGTYAYNLAAVIDWGTFINAVISFLIIAVTLFIIVKVAAKMAKARADMKAKQLEAYYVKHPEERPVPPEPGIPEPTDHEILKEMLEVLKGKKAE